MEGFDPRTSFGDTISRRYVARETRGDEGDAVACLSGLAASRDALEMAVGAGRIALPLARTGLRVDGIEQSEAMIARLREKPGGDGIEVRLGDMSRIEMGRRYGLVYLVYNTIGNLLTQEDQVRCFENAARHLAADGVFVLECRVPTPQDLAGRAFVELEDIAAREVTLRVGRYDAVSQRLDASHVRLTERGVELSPISLRLVAPSELDLMARIAGLRLAERWGGWLRQPFTASSWRHVSVYRLVS